MPNGKYVLARDELPKLIRTRPPKKSPARRQVRQAQKVFVRTVSKAAKKQGKPKPFVRSFKRGGAAIDFSTGRLVAGWRSGGTRVVRGVEITSFIFTTILADVTTDSAGLLGTSGSVPSNAGISLKTDLFDRLQTISAAEDRCRLKSFVAHFSPAVGTAVNGKGWWYYEYGGDAIVTTAKLASQMQQVKEFVPWQSSIQTWHKQDNVDSQWVAANGSRGFNSKITHKLYMFGNFPLVTSTIIGYLWGRAVVEFTGRQ